MTLNFHLPVTVPEKHNLIVPNHTISVFIALAFDSILYYYKFYIMFCGPRRINGVLRY